MFDVNDYYLGLIFSSPNYYKNKKSKQRLLSCPEADPFYGLTKDQSLIIGNVVLLRKSNDTYYDEDYSIFRNELSYHLNKPNRLGIVLAYVKPFSECYSDTPKIYNQDDIFGNDDIIDEIIDLPYYVIHYEDNDNYSVIINEDSPLISVRYEYFRTMMGNEDFYNMINHDSSQKKK